MTDELEQFRNRRARGNEALLDTDNLSIKRLMGLDKNVYDAGSLDTPTKELLGLVASMVLRCDDCIDYHLERCVEEGYDKAQLDEAMSVALLVGGTIVIPHARHAALNLQHLLAARET